MKNLQKIALGLIVCVMAIGFSAFTLIGEKQINSKLATTIYYNYIGTTYSESDYLNPDNWEYEPNAPSPCIGTGHICVLQVEDSDLTGSGSEVDNLIEYLTNNFTQPSDYVQDASNMKYQRF